MKGEFNQKLPRKRKRQQASFRCDTIQIMHLENGGLTIGGSVWPNFLIHNVTVVLNASTMVFSILPLHSQAFQSPVHSPHEDYYTARVSASALTSGLGEVFVGGGLFFSLEGVYSISGLCSIVVSSNHCHDICPD